MMIERERDNININYWNFWRVCPGRSRLWHSSRDLSRSGRVLKSSSLNALQNKLYKFVSMFARYSGDCKRLTCAFLWCASCHMLRAHLITASSSSYTQHQSAMCVFLSTYLISSSKGREWRQWHNHILY